MKRLLLLGAIFFQALFIQAQVQDSANKIPLIHVATVTNTRSNNYKESNTPSGRYFSVSTDLLQYLVHQPNFGVEFRYKKFAYGLNFGIVYPDAMFYVNPLADGQYTWPGLVYNGEAVRAYWKFFYTEDRPANYFGVQAEYKYLWYNNVSFVDQPSDELDIHYSMNEKATVLGLDVLYGYEWQLFKFMHLDLFGGVGLHVKLREYTVLPSAFSSNPFNQKFPPLVGNYKTTLTLPVPIMGLKFGFNCLHKTPEAN